MATTYNAGIVTAYGAAVRGGYTGTYEEFCRQQAGYAQSAAAVEQAKQDVQELVDGIPADYTQLSDDVSSLKEDLNLFTNNKTYTYTKNKSISNTAPTTQVAENNWESVIVPCSEGDVFSVLGYGGNSTRLWMFADSSGSLLTQSPPTYNPSTYETITAPANAAYLSCNSRYANKSGSLIKGKPLCDDVSSLDHDLDAITSSTSLMFSASGYCMNCASSPVSLTPFATSSSYRYILTDCTEGDRFTVTGTGGQSPKLWCFLDSSNAILASAGNNASLSNGVIIAPKNAKKLIINDNTKAGYVYKGVCLDQLLFNGKEKLGNIIPSITNWRADIAGYDANNPVYPVSPEDMPKNTYAYATGAAFSGFNNTVFTLTPSSAYWFIKINNANASSVIADVCMFIIIEPSTGYMYIGRSANNGTTTNWVSLPTNQVTNNIYNNTYNVTATPAITSDSNYYLSSTGDTTDRTNDIATMLSTYKMCRLGTGVFYVNNLQMPRETRITGNGNSTVIVYNGNSSSGYAIKLGYYCSIDNVLIEQGTADYNPSGTSVGDVHGILFEGDADASTPTFIPRYCEVSNCHIRYFRGGGITCKNTGVAVNTSLQAVNCHIVNCNAGIYIPYSSEYHEFTNIKCFHCGIGLVNNGGNNAFVNCCFSQNKQGILMDNTNNQSPNNGHGSLVGCTINHSNNNSGTAIEMIGITNGFNFSSCHVFYGTISISESKGIVFGDTNAGAVSAITISGGGLILFHGATFNRAPTINVSNNPTVHFTDCYTRDGDVISVA